MTRNSNVLSAFVDSITDESAVDPAVDPAVDTTACVRVKQKTRMCTTDLRWFFTTTC